MKSQKELRLLAAVLLFVAGAAMFFGNVFVSGVPARHVVYALLISGSYVYLGVSLLVFKHKLRILNIIPFTIIVLDAVAKFAILIAQIVEAGALPSEVAFYIAAIAIMVFLAITILLLVYAFKKTDILMPFAILGGVYLVLFVTAAILEPSVFAEVGAIIELIYTALWLLGIGVTLIYYKLVDRENGETEELHCFGREVRKAHITGKNLGHVEKLAKLHKDGAITDKEFEEKKKALLDHVE